VHDAGVGKRVQRYELATGETRTLAQVADATLEDLRLPAVTADKAAWIHLIFEDEQAEEAEIFVETVDWSGTVRELALPGEPFTVAFSQDGGLLYWSTLARVQYATDLESLKTTTIAAGLGSLLFVSGTRVGWAPETRVGSTTVGYYDEETRTTYTHLIDDPVARSTLAWPLGEWFVWNVLYDGPDGNNDFERNVLHFLPLD
jgi:hypothetical protein